MKTDRSKAGTLKDRSNRRNRQKSDTMYQTQNDTQGNDGLEPHMSGQSSTLLRTSWTGVKILWICHTLVVLLILTVGTLQNGGKSKYTPVHPNVVSTELKQYCYKTYLNVLATTAQDADAILCCLYTDLAISGSGTNEDTIVVESLLSGTVSVVVKPETIASICPKKLQHQLPFANRLSRFPDAWLLPLFPLLLRMAITSFLESCHHGRLLLPNVYSWRRLAAYILLFNFRGWVLYLAFNSIEDRIVTRQSMSSIVECWYSGYFSQQNGERSDSCKGRVFDFSDHVVLYVAQILAVALLEFTYAWQVPYWHYRTSTWSSMNGALLLQIVTNSVPYVLSLFIIYLYSIVAIGMYKTALYFHTTGEVFFGLTVAMIVHIFVFKLHSSAPNNGCMAKLRSFLFQDTSSDYNNNNSNDRIT